MKINESQIKKVILQVLEEAHSDEVSDDDSKAETPYFPPFDPELELRQEFELEKAKAKQREYRGAPFDLPYEIWAQQVRENKINQIESFIEDVIVEMIEDGDLDVKVLSEIFGSSKMTVKKGRSLPGVESAGRMKDAKFAYETLKSLVPGEMDNPSARRNASKILAKFISSSLRPQAAGKQESPLNFFVNMTGDPEGEVRRVLQMAFDTIKGKI